MNNIVDNLILLEEQPYRVWILAWSLGLKP